MRELKFRAWTGISMEYRVVVGALGAFYVQGLDPNDSACMSHMNTIYTKETHIMQFTGQLDKNGTEIYKGDIGQLGEYLCVLEWDEKDCRFWWIDTESHQWINGRPSDADILGNIYEHPELIKN